MARLSTLLVFVGIAVIYAASSASATQHLAKLTGRAATQATHLRWKVEVCRVEFSHAIAKETEGLDNEKMEFMIKAFGALKATKEDAKKHAFASTKHETGTCVTQPNKKDMACFKSFDKSSRPTFDVTIPNKALGYERLGRANRMGGVDVHEPSVYLQLVEHDSLSLNDRIGFARFAPKQTWEDEFGDEGLTQCKKHDMIKNLSIFGLGGGFSKGVRSHMHSGHIYVRLTAI